MREIGSVGGSDEFQDINQRFAPSQKQSLTYFNLHLQALVSPPSLRPQLPQPNRVRTTSDMYAGACYSSYFAGTPNAEEREDGRGQAVVLEGGGEEKEREREKCRREGRSKRRQRG